MIALTGPTFVIREELMQMNGRWRPDKQAWLFDDKFAVRVKRLAKRNSDLEWFEFQEPVSVARNPPGLTWDEPKNFKDSWGYEVKTWLGRNVSGTDQARITVNKDGRYTWSVRKKGQGFTKSLKDAKEQASANYSGKRWVSFAKNPSDNDDLTYLHDEYDDTTARKANRAVRHNPSSETDAQIRLNTLLLQAKRLATAQRWETLEDFAADKQNEFLGYCSWILGKPLGSSKDKWEAQATLCCAHEFNRGKLHVSCVGKPFATLA